MLSFTSRIHKDDILAKSEGAEYVDPDHFVNFSLPYTNSNWTMSVVFEDGLEPPWLGWAIAGSVIGSFALTVLLSLILLGKQANQNLLNEMLPKKALRKIQRGQTVVEKYNMVTICFCDIVGYTSMSADMRPIEVMEMLNSFYNEVDKLTDKHNVYKIKIIGDAYMCVGGCPELCSGPEGAERVALFALDVIELVKNFRTDDGSQILIRAGINSGSVVAGVVGTKCPQYTVLGAAVNAASRMESTSEEMKIQCSDTTHLLLRHAPNYEVFLTQRGDEKIQGKGHISTWFIEGATKRCMQIEESISNSEYVASHDIEDSNTL